jgi:hypothetical protein
MKKLLKAFLLVIISIASSYGQQRPALARIHAAKMAYITDRLRLSPEQCGYFVPVFNEYEREIRDTRVFFFKKYKDTNPNNADDATSRQFIDDNLDYQQQVIEIKRKYNDRFLKIISPQQLADLYKAEREFKQMLMKRLEQRRNGGRFNRRNGY